MMRRKIAVRPKPGVMNPLQMHGMFVIAEHPHITMKELAELMHVTSPSATSFVDRLVKLKWVKREADARNRKLVRLRVQPEGRTQLAKCLKEHSMIMHTLFSLLSKADQKQFERILLNLKHALAVHDSSR